MTYGNPGGTGTSAYYQSFDELKLDQGQIQKKTEKLKEKGYFSVPMSDTTRRYQHQPSRLSNPAWRNESVGKVVDLKATYYERSITAVAKDIATTLTGKQQQLRAHEFQWRRAKNQGQDRFYFFAGNGISEENIPKLVHRSPQQSGRSIFLARWQ